MENRKIEAQGLYSSTIYGMNPTHPAIFQPDLDAPGMGWGAGEDIFHDPLCKCAASLVLF